MMYVTVLMKLNDDALLPYYYKCLALVSNPRASYYYVEHIVH